MNDTALNELREIKILLKKILAALTEKRERQRRSIAAIEGRGAQGEE